MNNRGFTLLELVAVLIILAILALIAAPITIEIINNSKTEAQLIGAENYIHAAELSLLSNKIKSGVCTVQSDGNLLCDSDEVIVDIEKNKPNSGKITVSNWKITTVEALDYSNNKTQISYSKTADESKLRKDTILCNLISGNSKQIGSKYTCHLDTDRTFYVLRVTSSEITLLMDQNLGDTVGWCSDESRCKSGNYFSNLFGPLTAQDALDTRTSSWKNLKYISIDVVLPQVSWFSDLGCTSTNNSCPSWVYINLTTTSGQKPWGYWTANRVDTTNMNAYGIKRGSIKDYDTVQSVGEYGIRPVIIIKKYNLN